jgi:hypothetical protein
LSVEERYGTSGNYHFAVAVAAKRLIAQRYLLPADGARLTAQALQDISTLLPPR